MYFLTAEICHGEYPNKKNLTFKCDSMNIETYHLKEIKKRSFFLK